MRAWESSPIHGKRLETLPSVAREAARTLESTQALGRVEGGSGKCPHKKLKGCIKTREVTSSLHTISLQLSLCNHGIKTWNLTLLQCMCRVLCHSLTGVNSHNHYCSQDKEVRHQCKDFPHATPLESHLSSPPNHF